MFEPQEEAAPPAPNSGGAGKTGERVARSVSGTPRIGGGGGIVLRDGLVCCVCGATDARPWRTSGDNLLGGPAVWQAVRCVRCGTARLDPRPPAERMAYFYPPDLYARSEPDAASGTDEIGRRLDQYNDSLAERAARALTSGAGGKTVLDVGCGDGRFLAALSARGAAGVTGLETDPVAAKLARRRTGGPVLETALEDAGLPDAAFDLISLLHVLEHVPDPRATLTQARRVLRPSGALFLALPNAASLEAAVFGRAWYHLDLPRHLWGFGPRTLTRLLEETGFDVETVQFFPFLFAPQSVRNVLRSVRPARAAAATSHANEHGRRAAGSPKSALLTRFVAGWLRASERLGEMWPGEIMEIVARVRPGEKEKP